MAGQTHEVDIGNDDLLPPWSTLFEVVAATDVDQWVLVGGLMVQLHAYRADIPPSRTTKDVDMVVDVVTAKAGIQAVAGQLEAIGARHLRRSLGRGHGEPRAPDVIGALIAKGAAYSVDQRDRARHLEDAALLLASIEAVGKLNLVDLSKNDRRHLVRVATMLPDGAPAWRELEIVYRLRGQRQLTRLIEAAALAVPGRPG